MQAHLIGGGYMLSSTQAPAQACPTLSIGPIRIRDAHQCDDDRLRLVPRVI